MLPSDSASTIRHKQLRSCRGGHSMARQVARKGLLPRRLTWCVQLLAAAMAVVLHGCIVIASLPRLFALAVEQHGLPAQCRSLVVLPWRLPLCRQGHSWRLSAPLHRLQAKGPLMGLMDHPLKGLGIPQLEFLRKLQWLVSPQGSRQKRAGLRMRVANLSLVHAPSRHLEDRWIPCHSSLRCWLASCGRTLPNLNLCSLWPSWRSTSRRWLLLMQDLWMSSSLQSSSSPTQRPCVQQRGCLQLSTGLQWQSWRSNWPRHKTHWWQRRQSWWSWRHRPKNKWIVFSCCPDPSSSLKLGGGGSSTHSH